MKIAVIGAGVSGLVAALLLGDTHEVTLFEAADRPGGHTNTVDVPTATGILAVDTGFIVFNDRNYPHFRRLIDRLGVASQASDMSFSVADEHGRFEYASTSLNGLWATRRNVVDLRFARMVAEVPRFQRVLTRLLSSAEDPDLSLAELLDREGFSELFVRRLVVPQVAAVWSADPEAMDRFPARLLATFFHNHGMLSLRDRPRWSVISGGSRTYVEAICRRLGDRLALASPVRSVRRRPDGVELEVRGRETERFDHVVLATHSDTALEILGEAATETERSLLGAIPYQLNEAVLHTDTALLPRRRRAWASWNYHLLGEPGNRATVTYHMNRLQSLSADREFCVTLNHSDVISADTVIARFEYAHPVFTPEGLRAQARVSEISGADRVHFCGAYWGWGFHEDGVASAVRVCESLGVSW